MMMMMIAGETVDFQGDQSSFWTGTTRGWNFQVDLLSNWNGMGTDVAATNMLMTKLNRTINRTAGIGSIIVYI